MKTKEMNLKLLLITSFGHLLCWVGGDLLLYFVPNGPLDTMQLFSYEKTVEMLEGVNPMQFTVSGVVGTIAMMLALLGYYQIYQFLKPVAKGAANVHCAHAGKRNSRDKGKRNGVYKACPFRQTGLASDYGDEQGNTHHKHADVAHSCGCHCFCEESQHNIVSLLCCSGLNEIPEH